jgi:SAM-dependent methyltransferase
MNYSSITLGQVGRKRRQQPLIIRVLRPMWAQCNDIALRIRTIPSPQAVSTTSGLDLPQILSQPKHSDSVAYEVPDYTYLRKIRRMLNPGPDDVVYDLGCGMGRFICLMAQRKVRRCVGVELQPPLCDIAQRNARRLRGRQAPVEIVCADAATADISQGSIYYMYNPFGADTLRDVLDNLRCSLSANPRKATLVYYNAIHEWLFSAEPWLEKYREFKTFSQMPVTFWRTLFE